MAEPCTWRTNTSNGSASQTISLPASRLPRSISLRVQKGRSTPSTTRPMALLPPLSRTTRLSGRAYTGYRKGGVRVRLPAKCGW